MSIVVRRATPADVPECASILFSAFKTLADHHRFPSDFPSPEAATAVLAQRTSHPEFWGVVAEDNGCIAGSNFADFRSSIAGIGPISVDPEGQNRGIGQRLMQTAMDEAERRQCMGVRLVQAGYHARSLSLYAKLGFCVREPLSIMQGQPLGKPLPGYEVRPVTQADVGACGRLCRAVHGFERDEEVRDALNGPGLVVEHLGAVVGYSTGVGFRGHTVSTSNAGMIALIAASPTFGGLGFLLPSRNQEVLTWCLNNGLRLVMQDTLMSIGFYKEPCGAWMPSILY